MVLYFLLNCIFAGHSSKVWELKDCRFREIFLSKVDTEVLTFLEILADFLRDSSWSIFLEILHDKIFLWFLSQVSDVESSICLWLHIEIEDINWIRTQSFCMWSSLNDVWLYNWHLMFRKSFRNECWITFFFDFFFSMVISSQILNMKMFNTLFVVMRIAHMLTTSSSPILLDFPGTDLLCRELMGLI